MPVIGKNGKALSPKEMSTILTMVKSTYENYIKHCENIDEGKQDEEIKTLTDTCRKRLETIDDDYIGKANGAEIISLSDLLNNEIGSTLYQEMVNSDYRQRIDDSPNMEIAVILLGTLGDSQIAEYLGTDMNPQDLDGTFERTTAPFKLADKALDGVEDIMEYNPNSDRVYTLNLIRRGNSVTLSYNREKAEAEKAELDEQLANGRISDGDYNEALLKNEESIKKAEKGIFANNAAIEKSRIFASELINKEKVSFDDVFNIFSDINATLRPGDPDGGKLRGEYVRVGDKIQGVGITKVPVRMYETTQLIADYINIIKEQPDRNLQKTQAIQLAEFAYSLTLSEHMFRDGNGRSCRLLSDTILQSFGLPPHIATEKELTTAGTLGDTLDFDAGTQIFLEEVKQSSDLLKPEKEADLKKRGIENSAPVVQRKPSDIGVEIEKPLISDEGAADIIMLKKDTAAAKGRFRDSKEYKDFIASVDILESLSSAMNKAQKDGKISVNISKLSSLTQKLVHEQFPNAKKELLLTDSEMLMRSAAKGVRKAAEDYVNYKMKDHTADPEHINAKKLNADDIKKLGVMEQVLGKERVNELISINEAKHERLAEKAPVDKGGIQI